MSIQNALQASDRYPEATPAQRDAARGLIREAAAEATNHNNGRTRWVAFQQVPRGESWAEAREREAILKAKDVYWSVFWEKINSHEDPIVRDYARARLNDT